MKVGILALDYDGTIATGNVLDAGVRSAITDARAAGIAVLIVTGRILRDLRRVAGDLGFVDAIVAENGCVVTFPDSGRTTVVGDAPPVALLAELERRGVRVDTGECVIEADASAAGEMLDVIRKTEAPLALVFNRDRLMVLPRGITKGTGLRRALATLRLSRHNAIGIGDAENDHELLGACEIGVAVGWGSEALKAGADAVLDGTGPPAVAAYIRQVTQAPQLSPARTARRQLLLGRANGQPFSLAVRGRNVLVTGDPRSGKSWVTGLLCEQLILHEYSVCIIDPEGDYTGLESLPGVVTLGGHRGPPRPRDLLRALQYPDASVVVDLSQVAHHEKVEYIKTVLPTLAGLRRQVGIPHRIVVDEAHYFLHDPDVPYQLDLDLGGYTLTSYQPSWLHPDVLASAEARIVTRTTDPRQVAALAPMSRVGDAPPWQTLLGTLGIGEAVVLPGTDETRGEPVRVELVARLTSHVRHRAKYIDVPVPESRAFVFSRGGRPVGPRARTLREFIDALACLSDGVAAAHAARGDFARWIEDVFGDHQLASHIRKVEAQHAVGWNADLQDAVIALIRDRYDLAS